MERINKLMWRIMTDSGLGRKSSTEEVMCEHRDAI